MKQIPRPVQDRTVLARMAGVMAFDRTVYAEVQNDPAGTRQALVVVAMVAAGAALGTVLLSGWHPR